MKGTADLIPCSNGYQVEIALLCNWTLYSPIYRDAQAAHKAAAAMAKKLRIELSWSEAAEAKEESDVSKDN